MSDTNPIITALAEALPAWEWRAGGGCIEGRCDAATITLYPEPWGDAVGVQLKLAHMETHHRGCLRASYPPRAQAALVTELLTEARAQWQRHADRMTRALTRMG